MQNVLENKLVEMFANEMHLYLLLGIFSVLYILRKVPYVKAIFSKKWKWSIGFVNVSLSSIGIFLLKMTHVETFGAKMCVMLAISAFATFSYELMKPLLVAVAKRFFPKLLSDGNKN